VNNQPQFSRSGSEDALPTGTSSQHVLVNITCYFGKTICPTICPVFDLKQNPKSARVVGYAFALKPTSPHPPVPLVSTILPGTQDLPASLSLGLISPGPSSMKLELESKIVASRVQGEDAATLSHPHSSSSWVMSYLSSTSTSTSRLKYLNPLRLSPTTSA